MKALTVRQPSAWSIIYAGKDIENRDWPTRFRGTVAIHAASIMTRDDYQSFCEFYSRIRGADILITMPVFKELVRGAIIGLVDIVDCVTEHNSEWLEGEYGFVLKNPRPLIEPIYCKGSLGFWNVPSAILQKLKYSRSS
jgi:hypothetical protein